MFALRDEVAVPPSYAFVNINSRDRNTTTANPTFLASGGDLQPWNSFIVQRPQPILNAFSRRIGVVEINFPWGIPNITQVNNTLYVFNYTTSTNYAIVISTGFYSGTAMASALNTAIAAVIPTNSPTFTWSTTSNQMTFNANGGNYHIAATSAATVGSGDYGKFYSLPSLVRTMGFSLIQTYSSIAGSQTLTGAVSQLLYTSYVDVVSEKLHYNNEVQDGSSSNNRAITNVLCRIFVADESSNNLLTIGQAPFLIHRQFRNPKMLKWDPEAMVDWFQISIYDEYGNLVQLPAAVSQAGTPGASYPDFQLTMIATEN
jgi:hypothetical protein